MKNSSYGSPPKYISIRNPWWLMFELCICLMNSAMTSFQY